MAHPDNVVWGITLEDEGTAKLARRVLIVSTVMALLVIAAGVIEIVYVGATDPMLIAVPIFGILLGLLIPACGYFGAKRRDRNLLNCFACCNCCSVVMYILSAIIILITRGSLDRVHEECLRTNSHADCELYLPENYTPFMALSLSIGFLPFVLSMLGCVWGRQLATRPMFTSDYSAGPVSTYGTAPQPGAVYVPTGVYGAAHPGSGAAHPTAPSNFGQPQYSHPQYAHVPPYAAQQPPYPQQPQYAQYPVKPPSEDPPRRF